MTDSLATPATFRVECQPESAPRLLDWIANRGGIARWPSINLSDPSRYVLTPAKTTTGEPTTKPGWSYGSTPEIITNPAEVGVYQEELFKAVPVTLRRSSNGLSLKITDATQRKVDRIIAACEAKHGSHHIRKGVLPDVPASIGVYFTTSIEPLS